SSVFLEDFCYPAYLTQCTQPAVPLGMARIIGCLLLAASVKLIKLTFFRSFGQSFNETCFLAAFAAQ
ncbi:hypothetical protein VT06_05990, partial [Arsukibacterium sp. MJ3]